MHGVKKKEMKEERVLTLLAPLRTDPLGLYFGRLVQLVRTGQEGALSPNPSLMAAVTFEGRRLKAK